MFQLSEVLSQRIGSVASKPSPLEALEPRLLFTAVPIITEFLASNDSTLDDEDGDSSDWLEIYNAGSSALDLNGWYLTDDADELAQWAFPAVSVDPGQYLLVFASAKDRADADGTELHTNFRLGAGGEYLALVQADGTTIAHHYSPEYPAQSADVSFGLSQQRAETALIAEGATARYRVPTGSISNWNSRSFNDSTWAQGATGIGYETDPIDGENPYDPYLETELDLSGGHPVSLYVRQHFSLTDPDAFSFLDLGVRYDDGFAAYLNGELVASQFAPSNPTWNSTSDPSNTGRSDALSTEFQNFDISAHLDKLLVGDNVLAIQVFNASTNSSDLLIEPILTAGTTTTSTSVMGFMATPTPGAINVSSGPIISSVTENPTAPTPTQDLVIQATVHESVGNGLSRVDLHYRVNFASEAFLQIFDNGLGADQVAGDGIYTGVISSGAYDAGDMVRWYVTAEDNGGNTSRAPLALDQSGQDRDAEYFGTVVQDSSIDTQLGVLHWFVEDPEAARTDQGTRASVYYNGKFYDNVFVRRRGASSAGWPKRNYKFDFNGQVFEYDPSQPLVEEFNLASTYSDKSYIRQILANELFRDAGAAYSEVSPWRVEQNGEFFSVAIFIEQPDEDFLERNGLDKDGALYKYVGDTSVGFAQVNSGVEKKTRLDESRTDLANFIAGISTGNSDRNDFLFDNVDLASVINYIAVSNIVHNNDHAAKNFYAYRDTEGSGEWRFIPWDLDLTFGRNFGAGGDVLSDGIWADDDRMSHPFFGDSDHQKVDGPWNLLIDAVLDNPTAREMYLRRLRTLMDQFLQPAGTPSGQLYFETRIDELIAQMAPDVALDRAKWGNPYGANQSFQNAVNILKNDFLAVRRQHFYTNHSVNNPSYPDNAGIPDAQAAAPTLTIGDLDFAPVSGENDEEYIQIINHNGFAIDISGWTVEGAIAHTFKPGTVIAIGESLYITAKSTAFRTRTTGPAGGQGLFVQQWDSGQLSAFGETITIKRTDGTTAAQLTYEGTSPGDITGDGFVGIEDLDQLLAYWGDAATSSPEADAADLDDSGSVGGGDLTIVFDNWGRGTPAAQPTSNGDVPDDPDPGRAPGSGDTDIGRGDAGTGDGIDADAGRDTAPEGAAEGDAVIDEGGPSSEGADEAGDHPAAPVEFEDVNADSGDGTGGEGTTLRNKTTWDNGTTQPEKPAEKPNPVEKPGAPADKSGKPIPALDQMRTKRNTSDALALTRPISSKSKAIPQPNTEVQPARRFDALVFRR